MHDIVIKNGWYRKNKEKRQAEFDLYDNNLGQLWGKMNSIFSSPAYSSDHLFSLITSEKHVDLNKESDLKTIAKIIDESAAFQDELLKLSCFGGRDNKPFEQKFKEQPQFASYVFEHCPSFVARIDNESALKGLLLDFPGTAPVLLSKPYLDGEDTKEFAARLLDSLSIYEEVLPVLTTLPVGAEASYLWRALSFLYRDETNNLPQQATAVINAVAAYEPVDADGSSLKSLYALLYDTPDEQKKQLVNVFIEFPAIFSAACGESNQHLSTLLSSQEDPLAFLATLGESEAGRAVIAEKIEDIALYVLENFKETDPKVQRLFLEPATEDAPETYRKLIAKHIGKLLTDMDEDKLDYTTLAVRASKLLSYDIVRKEIGLDFLQLKELMQVDAPKQCDPLLEKYIGGDELLASRLMAYKPYKDVVFTSKKDAQNRNIYVYSRAFWIIRDQLSDDLAKNLDNNEFVSAHAAYMFITKDEWWNEVTPFTLGYFLLALMAAIASVISNSLKKYFDEKLGKRIEPLQAKNVLFRMRCDYESQSKKKSFDEFLVENTPMVVVQPTVSQFERQDAMRLWFSVANAADIYQLMSADYVHPDFKVVFNEKPIYQALFLQQLRKQPDAAPKILDDFEDDLDDESIRENIFTPNKRLQQHTIEKVDSARKIKIILEEDLTPEKAKNVPEDLGVLEHMLALTDEKIQSDFSAEQLLRFFKLNKANHRRFFEEKPVAREIILQEPMTMVEVALEPVFASALKSDPKYLTQLLQSEDLPQDVIYALLRNGADLLGDMLLLNLDFKSDHTQDNLKGILNGRYGGKIRRVIKNNDNVPQYLAVLKAEAVADEQKIVINDLCLELNSDPAELDTDWMAKLLTHKDCDQKALLAMKDVFSIAKPKQRENMIRRNDKLLALEDESFAKTMLEFMSAKERSQLVMDLLPNLMAGSESVSTFFETNPKVLVSVLTKLNDAQLTWLYEHFGNDVVQKAIFENRELIERIDPEHKDDLNVAHVKNLASLIAEGKAEYVYSDEEFKDNYLRIILDVFKQQFAGFEQRQAVVGVLRQHLVGVLDGENIKDLVLDDKMPCRFFELNCPEAFSDFRLIHLSDVIIDGSVVLEEAFLLNAALEGSFKNTIEQPNNRGLRWFGLRRLFLKEEYQGYGEFFKTLFEKHAETLGKHLEPKDWMEYAKNPVLFNAALSVKGGKIKKSPEMIGLSFEMFLLLAREEKIFNPLCELFATEGVPEFVSACYHQASLEDKSLLSKAMISALREADPAKYSRLSDSQIKPFGQEPSKNRYDLNDTLKTLRKPKYPGVPDDEAWTGDKVVTCVNDNPLAAVSVYFYPHLQSSLEHTHCEPLNRLLMGIGEVEANDILRQALRKIRQSPSDGEDSE